MAVRYHLTTVGKKIAQLRTQYGWTLKQLSTRSGVSVSHISAIENGTRPNPSFGHIVKLAQAFSLSLDYFGEEPAPDGYMVRDARSGATSLRQGQEEFTKLYDASTQAFLLRESSKPYVVLAKQLSEHTERMNPAKLLGLIADFMDARDVGEDIE
jgi:transcriptional regulator with XRE-family HTH domain